MNKKALKITGEVCKWILLAFIGLFAFRQLWNFVDSKNGSHHPFFGRKDTVIVTGSMSFVAEKNKEELEGITNQIQINDVVVTSNRITYDSLEVHDIILFRSDKGDICHRIVKKYVSDDGKEMIITRGDANEIVDGAIEYTDVIGKVVKVRPKAGYIVSFVNSPYFLLGISIAAGCVAAGFLIAGKQKKEPNAETVSSDNSEQPEENNNQQ